MFLGRKVKKNYIFIDESGKPEVYSQKGTNLVSAGTASKYLVLAAIRCQNQIELQQKVTDFKSRLLQDKELTKMFSSTYTLDTFHAQTDYPQVKERFYQFIKKLNLPTNVIVVEKLKCYPWLQRNPGRLYGFMAGQLLKSIVHRAESTEIIFSRKDSKLKLRQELEVEVERVRQNFLNDHKIEGEFKLNYYHNPHYRHSGLQIADYIAYATFQLYQNNNDQWHKIISKQITTVHDICNKKYLIRSNPPQLST